MYEEAFKNAEEAPMGYLKALQKNGESNPEESHPVEAIETPG